jgi:hypothetical protein
MDKKTLNEIIACLPQGKTLFHYFKDRYALILLSRFITNPTPVAQLKRTNYARLLERPVIKNILAHLGQKPVNRALLENVWCNPSYAFLLTVSTWDGQQWTKQQTSRAGYNLVLQLNFSNQHEQLYRRLLKPSSESTFKCYGHPVMKRGERNFFRETLAWARIDLDFADDQALIEEVQSDWVPIAQISWRKVSPTDDYLPTSIYIDGLEGDTTDIKTYFTQVLKPYSQIWQEALLTATITFIRDELGIHQIFYHSYNTKTMLNNCQPPRDLYTQLPKKFCFQKTPEAPSFLQRFKGFRKSIKKITQPSWYQLQL